MKKEKIKKQKKTIKQKIVDKLMVQMKPYVDNYVKEHDKWLIEQVIHRIEFLSVQPNFSIDLLITDIKKGDFENDKEKPV